MSILPLTGPHNRVNGPAAITVFSRWHPVPAIPKRIFCGPSPGCSWSKNVYYNRYVTSYFNTRYSGEPGEGASPGAGGRAPRSGREPRIDGGGFPQVLIPRGN